MCVCVGEKERSLKLEIQILLCVPRTLENALRCDAF